MSNELTINRTPEQIAAEINSIKEQTRRQVLYNSIEIGRRLTEAKSLVPHGEWGEWLENRVEYSKSTANNLMKIFKEYGADQLTLLGNNAKSQAIGELSYTQAIALLGIKNPEERENFIENNNINDMSTRELKEKVKEIERLSNENEQLTKDNMELKKTTQVTMDRNASLTEKLKNLEKTSEEAFKSLEEANEKILESQKETEQYKSKVQELENRPVEVVTGVDESKVNELKEKHKKEIEAYNKKILEYEESLSELENRKPEVIKEVDESNIKELEEQHQKEIEKLKNEIEKSKAKVEDLKIKLEESDKKAKSSSDNLVRCKLELKNIVSSFKGMFKDIESLQEEEKALCKENAKKIIGMMLEAL